MALSIARQRARETTDQLHATGKLHSASARKFGVEVPNIILDTWMTISQI